MVPSNREKYVLTPWPTYKSEPPIVPRHGSEVVYALFCGWNFRADGRMNCASKWNAGEVLEARLT